MGHLDEALRLRRDDRYNDQAITTALRGSFDQLNLVFSRQPSLEFSITEAGLSYMGQALHRRHSLSAQLIGRLFQAGLRRLNVVRGLTFEDWARFVEVADAGRGLQLFGTTALITALWKNEGPCLSFLFRQRQKLLIEDDADAVERELRQISRSVTALVAAAQDQHGRLAAAAKPQGGLPQLNWSEPPNVVLTRFGRLLIELIDDDEEGLLDDPLRRGALNLTREAFRTGELRPLLAFITALNAPAEEGKRAAAIRRERLAILVTGACCEPNMVIDFDGDEEQLQAITELIRRLGFDAIEPFTKLVRRRPEPALATAVAQGLGERMNTASRQLRGLLRDPAAEPAVVAFLEGLGDFVPSAQVIGVLDEVKGHSNPDIADAVVQLLCRAVQIDDLDHALRLLGRSDETERQAALNFFAAHRDERSAAAFVEFLNNLPDEGWGQRNQRQAYKILGAMRTHNGFEHLKALLTATTITGRFRTTPEKQVLAVRGLASAGDEMAVALLREVMSDSRYPGPVRLAVERMWKQPL